MEFPVRYSFNCVGKTSGDEKLQTTYIERVKEVVLATSGDEEGIVCKVTPRGKKFTKVQCEVSVESVSMINMIYDDLEKIDMTVMRF